MMGEYVNLSWPSHSITLIDGLWHFLNENYKTKLEMYSRDNVSCHVHQLMMAIFCPSLTGKAENNRLKLTADANFQAGDLKSMVEFIYRGQVTVLEERIDSLLAGARSLELQPLIEAINQFKIGKNCGLLEVEHLPKKKENEDDEDGECQDNKIKEKKEIVEYKVRSKRKCVELRMAAEYKGNDDCSRKRYKRRKADGVKESFNMVRNQHVCGYCDKGFASKERYCRHMRCHQNPDQLHTCPRCEYKTGEKYILIQHMASRHRLDADGNPLAKDLKCSHCDFKCVSNFQLRNHVFHKHSTKTFKCTECDYSCVKKADHDKHVRAKHRNERPYLCELCGYRGKTLSAFKCHMRTHTGERPFICEVCSQSFSLSGTLKCHQKVHGNEEKPHPCHLCSFSTWKRYNLKVHLKHVHKDMFNDDAVCEQVTAEWRDMRHHHSDMVEISHGKTRPIQATYTHF